MKNPETILNECKRMLDLLDIDYGTIDQIKVNTRAQSRWGRATRHPDGTYKIEISDRLLKDDVATEAVYNTMMHELLHTGKDCMKHTGEWKRRAELVNNRYGMNIQRCTSADEKGLDSYVSKEKIHYHVICDSCGAKWNYKRKTKMIKILNGELLTYRPIGYRCPKCHGRSFTVAEVF